MTFNFSHFCLESLGQRLEIRWRWQFLLLPGQPKLAFLVYHSVERSRSRWCLRAFSTRLLTPLLHFVHLLIPLGQVLSALPSPLLRLIRIHASLHRDPSNSTCVRQTSTSSYCSSLLATSDFPVDRRIRCTSPAFVGERFGLSSSLRIEFLADRSQQLSYLLSLFFEPCPHLFVLEDCQAQGRDDADGEEDA